MAASSAYGASEQRSYRRNGPSPVRGRMALDGVRRNGQGERTESFASGTPGHRGEWGSEYDNDGLDPEKPMLPATTVVAPAIYVTPDKEIQSIVTNVLPVRSEADSSSQMFEKDSRPLRNGTFKQGSGVVRQLASTTLSQGSGAYQVRSDGTTKVVIPTRSQSGVVPATPTGSVTSGQIRVVRRAGPPSTTSSRAGSISVQSSHHGGGGSRVGRPVQVRSVRAVPVSAPAAVDLSASSQSQGTPIMRAGPAGDAGRSLVEQLNQLASPAGNTKQINGSTGKRQPRSSVPGSGLDALKNLELEFSPQGSRTSSLLTSSQLTRVVAARTLSTQAVPHGQKSSAAAEPTRPAAVRSNSKGRPVSREELLASGCLVEAPAVEVPGARRSVTIPQTQHQLPPTLQSKGPAQNIQEPQQFLPPPSPPQEPQQLQQMPQHQPAGYPQQARRPSNAGGLPPPPSAAMAIAAVTGGFRPQQPFAGGGGGGGPIVVTVPTGGFPARAPPAALPQHHMGASLAPYPQNGSAPPSDFNSAGWGRDWENMMAQQAKMMSH